MGKEIIGRILMVVGTIVSFKISLWAPIIAAPLIFRPYNSIFCFRDRIYNNSHRLILDMITHCCYIGYLFLCIVIFYQKIGRWYGGLIGFFVFLILAQILGLLWPRRWHYERIEGNI